ncbi:hypothetical protein B2G71_11355 [Novosphingobium sp. PC22D]|nr:hypothetical protein B2G71_11355 [Novosphingobium sp. PC22D]
MGQLIISASLSSWFEFPFARWSAFDAVENALLQLRLVERWNETREGIRSVASRHSVEVRLSESEPISAPGKVWPQRIQSAMDRQCQATSMLAHIEGHDRKFTTAA